MNTDCMCSTNFEIYEDCVAVEAECDMSDGLFVHAILINYYEASIFCSILKLYQYDCGLGKSKDLRHVTN